MSLTLLKNLIATGLHRANGLHVDQSPQGFLTFKVGKTQFRGLCLSPLSRALGQLSYYEKKGGSFHFKPVPLNVIKCAPAPHSQDQCTGDQ